MRILYWYFIVVAWHGYQHETPAWSRSICVAASAQDCDASDVDQSCKGRGTQDGSSSSEELTPEEIAFADTRMHYRQSLERRLQGRADIHQYGNDDGDDEQDNDPQDDANDDDSNKYNSHDHPAAPSCADHSHHCRTWAERGECKTNPHYMIQLCRPSCGLCVPETSDAATPTESTLCHDDNQWCSVWASNGECTANHDYMKQHCQKSCDLCPPESMDEQLQRGGDMGVLQMVDHIADGTQRSDVLFTIHKAKNYMKYKGHASCRNADARCAWWATIGECAVNPTYMRRSCAPVCNSCDVPA